MVMSGGVAGEGRSRPLSGGLWTLFSWLRRDEHSSTESVSSAGSDRTAASFAFLAPALYGPGAGPTARAPPSPPSDSYRRRVREQGVRRQLERDLTLHRKYGLYGLGFDASLPLKERDRRAVSESPRAHVPGKRRAPPPPVAAVTLPRRRTRKRPAPPPPSPARRSTSHLSDLSPMLRLPVPDDHPHRRDDATDCKPQKYSKRDTPTKETKDVKIRHEKSFLKQIFENKKRNSTVDTVAVRLLPNISELDKQAAEMIEKYRLKEMSPADTHDGEVGKKESTSKRELEAWICTRCLRKYDSSVITCNYCLPLNKSNDFYKNSKVLNSDTQTKETIKNVTLGSSSANIEDKEKLKEILKEMKDNLPKRPKSELITSSKKSAREMETKDNPKVIEAATLRIGSSISVDQKPIAQSSTSGILTKPPEAVSQNINRTNNNALTTINSVIITQPTVFVHAKESNVVLNENKTYRETPNQSPIKKDANKPTTEGPSFIVTEIEKNISTDDPKPLSILSETKYDVNMPMKISSLLNPIYVPKMSSTTNTEAKLVKQVYLKDIKKEKTSLEPQSNTAENVKTAVLPSPDLIPMIQGTKKGDNSIYDTKNKPLQKVIALNENVQVQTNAKQDTKKEKTTAEPQYNTAVNVATAVIPSPDLIPTIQQTNKDDNSKCDTKNKQHNKEIVLNENVHIQTDAKPTNLEVRTSNSLVNSTSSNIDNPKANKDDRMDQHARRRNLINQLERSIARGDEKAAADAAVKLAQLKLSCSVLSFSSQIVADPAPSSSITPPKNTFHLNNRKTETNKMNEITQTSTANNVLTEVEERKTVIDKSDEKQPISSVKENLQIKQNIKTNILNLPKEISAKQTQASEAKNTVLLNPGPSEISTSKGDTTKNENDDGEIPILIWVEDKEATRGPVQLHVRRDAVMGELRRRAELSLGLAARLQRWIVGRALCVDDRASLTALAGPDLTAPFYLCLVESDPRTIKKTDAMLEVKEDPGNVYSELVKLEKQPLVSNAEVFECGVCIEECRPGFGVVLRECVHSFCKECLSDVVRHSEEPIVSCPAMGCRGVLQEREIRGLVSPNDYEKWLARGLAAAESGTRNAFHCRTKDCSGWALCDPGVRRFPCPVCKRTNCVPCQAIHEGETCEQHRTKLQSVSSEASHTDEGTRALLTSLISRGEALECPECSAIITKKWGCDWIKCSACKTEICWVTRGRRWGAAGRGDTSGGCRCGIDGKRCHPSCGYCH